MTHPLVFGYGSLLNQDDAKRSVPGIEYLYNALLPGHRISCTRFSKGRAGGVADVVPDAMHNVWGAVYMLSAADLRALDCREGVPSAYQRSCITVFRDGNKTNPVKVEVYTVVNKSKEPVPCTQEYRDLILQGARNRNFPDDYIRFLCSALIV